MLYSTRTQSHMTRGDYYVFLRLLLALLFLYLAGKAWKRNLPHSAIGLERYALFGIAGLLPAFIVCHFAGSAIHEAMQRISSAIQKSGNIWSNPSVGVILDIPPTFANWLVMLGGIAIGVVTAWMKRNKP